MMYPEDDWTGNTWETAPSETSTYSGWSGRKIVSDIGVRM